MLRSTLKITKVAAAQRQIDAAIRMFFLDIDELAVHSVAGAATKLLQELHRKRGADPMSLQVKAGLLGMIKEHLAGKSFGAEVDGILDSLAGSITAQQRHQLQISDNTTPLARELQGNVATGVFWQKMLKSVNFLKHSTRDEEKLLNAEDVNNVNLIGHAVSSYLQLGLPLTKSMTVFNGYFISRDGANTQGSLDESFWTIVKLLALLPDKKARATALELIDLKPARSNKQGG